MEAGGTAPTEDNSKSKAIQQDRRGCRDRRHHRGLDRCTVGTPASPCGLPMWPARRQTDPGEGEWIIVSLTRQRLPIAAAAPDVASLSEQISTSPGTCTPLLIWKTLFSLYLLIRPTGSRLLSAGKASNTPYLSYLRAMPALRPRVTIRFAGILQQDFAWIHDAGGVMPTGPRER